MNTILYARSRLQSMGKTPRMYALKREAFMIRVETILEMAMQDDFDWRTFHHKHMRVRGPVDLDLELPVEDEWARKVIADALEVLEGFRERQSNRARHSSELVAAALSLNNPAEATPQDVFDSIKEKSRDPNL